MNGERLYKMGEVVNKLFWEYPDKISAGTIRFWEKEGLLEPAGKTGGGQRLYTEEHINWIRFLKELSIAGVSIAKMRERVEHARRELEEFKNDPNSRKERIFYFIRTIETRRRRNTLDAELELFYHRLDGEQKTEKIYDIEALARVIGTKDARQMIEKAEQYGLLIPKTIDGVKRFSRYEEMILKVLVFMEFLKPGALERCKDLVSTVKYLTAEVGIYEGFRASRDHDGTTGYNATLYNLVLMSLDSLRLLK